MAKKIFYCKKDRCVFLNGDGKQCREPATKSGNYHGDGELYGYGKEDSAQWVRVRFCKKHFKGTNPSNI